jgi:hypothetical protein
MAKLLVLYVFNVFNNRVKHFINNCIFEDDNVDFVIISNGDNTFESPNFNNVRILIRDNVGFDFGGWSDALLSDNLYEKYDNFIFVNSSVYGPFLPTDYKGKWTDIYVNGLKDNIKLFGSTINTMENPISQSHVQTYIFSMDKTTAIYLINCGIFSKNYLDDLYAVVLQKEILMSRKIIENNWNIGSLMKHYENVDFGFTNKKPEDYNINFLNDIMFPEFRNSLWNDNELVFVKGNRLNINS